MNPNSGHRPTTTQERTLQFRAPSALDFRLFSSGVFPFSPAFCVYFSKEINAGETQRKFWVDKIYHYVAALSMQLYLADRPNRTSVESSIKALEGIWVSSSLFQERKFSPKRKFSAGHPCGHPAKNFGQALQILEK